MPVLNLFGERSLTLVGAEFPDLASASAAARALEADAMVEGEVAVVGPGDPRAAARFEPEQAGILSTALRSHAILGVAGLLAGLVGAAYAVGTWQAAASSAGLTAVFMAVMGAFFGMIVAGLITLRPDHALIISTLGRALARGRWTVVVRPLSERITHRAMATLRAAGAKPVRSF